MIHTNHGFEEYSKLDDELQDLKEQVRVGLNLREPEFSAIFLHETAAKGHLNTLKRLVAEEGLGVTCLNAEGNNLLHTAVLNGQYDVFWWLKKETKLDVLASNNQQQSVLSILRTTVDDKGNSFLHIAASKGDLVAVKWFVTEADIYIKAVNEAGDTPYDLAQRYYRTEVTIWLRKASQTSLADAAEHGDLEMVKWLTKVEMENTTGSNQGLIEALLKAADYGQIEVAKWLVEDCNVDSNSSNEEGTTPFLAAAKSGQLELVQWMVLHGKADILKGDGSGFTALHFAVSSGELEVVKWLVEEAKIDVDIVDEYHSTPLLCTAMRGVLDLLKYLVITAKADLYKADRSGWTILHLAASEGLFTFVEFLVKDVGMDINVRNQNGETPLNRAVQGSAREIMQLLVESGAEVDATDKDGFTALYWAAIRGNLDYFTYLVVYGKADFNRIDNNGDTILSLTNDDIKQWLRGCGYI